MKNHFRNEVKEKLKGLTAHQKKEKSRQITGKILKSPEWQKAELFLAYLSFQHEVDTEQLIQSAFEEGKLVGAPRIEGDTLIFHKWTGHNAIVHSYGMAEPHHLSPTIAPEDYNTLALIPGLAFDHGKNRLGRGKGFYDRFLEINSHKAFTSVGVCYHWQLYNRIPVSKNDKPVDLVITDEQIIY